MVAECCSPLASSFPSSHEPYRRGGSTRRCFYPSGRGSEVPISSTSVSLLLSGDPIACSGHNDFHPTVFSASCGRVIGCNRLFLAVAAGGDPLRTNAILHQKVPHRIGPPLRQI